MCWTVEVVVQARGALTTLCVMTWKVIVSRIYLNIHRTYGLHSLDTSLLIRMMTS